MKLRKCKNGTIRLTAENGQDSRDLLNFLASCAGEDSSFAKKAEEVEGKKIRKCPYCHSAEVIMFDADNDICNKCGKYFPGT
jgi:hypothetical protein